MLDWTKTFVSCESSLREVIATIDKAELQIALVVDKKTRLLGVITDGDVRRGLLKGLTLEAKAHEVMTQKPLTATPEMRLIAIEKLMQAHSLMHVPVIDEDGVMVSLAIQGKLLPRERFENEIFLMVGGLGTRLGELTKELPKPLLKIGNKPILEIILDSFLAQGFYKFTFAVNYKAELIESYFGDGSKWGADINYLRESKRMGTCGALSLIEERPELPFLVMNGDLLTKINFKHLLEFHKARNSLATMAVREYDVQVPFGVISLEGNRIKDLVEKPTQRYFVNAGVYVLSPEALDFIPNDSFYDITTLFQDLLHKGLPTHSFPIYEYWLDIGRMSDFHQAHIDFSEEWSESDIEGLS